MLKGAIHIHSTYSDGEFTLAELREVYTAAGCDFVCMSDHAEFFDADRLRAYVEECRALSDGRFRFIPGLEFTCERRMHVLGYGVTRLTTSTDPQAVIKHIDECGGVSVIAHPMDSAFPWIESFDVLPGGIETWNSKYDGRYAPRPGTFALLGRLQERQPQMRAFYGQDMHWRKQFRGLFNLVDCRANLDAEVLAALRRGAYVGAKSGLELPSAGRLPEPLVARFAGVHRRSDRLRRWVKRAHKLSKHLGATVPAPLKAQIRRIF